MTRIDFNALTSQKLVTIIDPLTTYIEDTVELGNGVIIHPMVTLKGRTIIGDNTIVYSFCDLTDTYVGENTNIRSTFAIGATIGNQCTVGPFATLRAGAIIGNKCRVGDYVEIKNSILEDNVKVAHLAYVGDSYVGDNTNIGCGVVFANYNGISKQSVKVGKNVFIGCNTNLVAPLIVDDNAYIAAGSTVVENVPNSALCIARARQVLKQNWDRK